MNQKGLFTIALVLGLAGQGTAYAQGIQPLTDKDREELAAMSVTYRRALMTCNGDEYANLFATPGGYFGSSSRGEVRDHKSLAEMVVGYDRCKQAPPANPGAVAGQRGSAYPAPVYEATPFGAKARIIRRGDPLDVSAVAWVRRVDEKVARHHRIDHESPVISRHRDLRRLVERDRLARAGGHLSAGDRAAVFGHDASLE